MVYLDHLLKEKDLEKYCPRCKKEHHASFKSFFSGADHYWIGFCYDCGYRILLKRDDLILAGWELNKNK